MPSCDIQWLSFVGDAPGWLALVLIAITMFRKPSELIAMREQMRTWKSELTRREAQIRRRDVQVSELIKVIKQHVQETGSHFSELIKKL